jgi:MOSC domain-containing protein YiiM
MTIEHIFISPEHNYFGHHGQPAGQAPVVALEEAELVAGKGIAGDRFFGWKEDYKGQITFFSREVHESLCAEFQVWDRGPEVFRRNVIVSGVDLNGLIGREFTVQGIRFLGMAECSPCYWMDGAFHPGAEASLKGRGGLRAKILTDGTLRRAAECSSRAWGLE